MKKLLLLGLICLLCVFVLTGGFALVYSEEKINIDELITQLGNDKFQKRESAQKELTEYGTKLIEQYRTAKRDKKQEVCNKTKEEIERLAQAIQNACNDNDAEVKNRATQIRQDFYSLTQPKIVFCSNRDGKGEIYIMDADGKNQTRLTGNRALGHSPAWNPDGKKIAFASYRDGNFEIYVMDADGKNQTRLTQDPAVGNSPAWSPDGKKIAFTSTRDGKYEIYDIYVMDADGKNQTRLTDNKARNSSPAWSQDGKKIAFYSDRDGNEAIYVMDADGKNQTRLTDNKAFDNSPAWSPDGKKVAFVVFIGWMSNLNRNGKGQYQYQIYDIYVMDADGKNQTRLTDNKASDILPAWSPDGKKIAFTSNRDGNQEIYVMNADGKNQTRLTDNKASDNDPVWNPSFLSLSEISALFAPLDLPDRQAGEKDKK